MFAYFIRKDIAEDSSRLNMEPDVVQQRHSSDQQCQGQISMSALNLSSQRLYELSFITFYLWKDKWMAEK